MPPKSYWARLPFSVRMTIGALAALLILGTVVAAFRTVVEDQHHPAAVPARTSHRHPADSPTAPMRW
ncbi:MAG: hypothetical protein QOH97_3584 [Actinoplanes sp.]|jgi:hypothetical protein|nr:hypothetical protein [Actinoplanes sp.]